MKIIGDEKSHDTVPLILLERTASLSQPVKVFQFLTCNTGTDEVYFCKV
jgi:hypothetical protein